MKQVSKQAVFVMCGQQWPQEHYCRKDPLFVVDHVGALLSNAEATLCDTCQLLWFALFVLSGYFQSKAR